MKLTLELLADMDPLFSSKLWRSVFHLRLTIRLTTTHVAVGCTYPGENIEHGGCTS